MNERRWLSLILGLFVILGAMYALVTPVFEASDELWHYPMIRHLADGNPLPVQVFDPAQAGPWKQEASQPPLYYYLGAALTFWIDASDMETIRWENPHVDNGILTNDGNINLTIHNPDWNPWQGTLLAVRIVRLFSVLLGALTVYLTYLIGKELAPKRPEIALGAAALNAFTPMFLFISGAVNNDNLAIPLASLAILLMIRAVGGRYSVNGNPLTDYRLPITDYWKTWLLIGIVIGLALLTKEGTFGLLPLALGTIFIAYWGERNAELRRGSTERHRENFWGDIFKTLGWTAVSFLILLLPVILIAGWWYWRNIVLYGDFLGWSAFIAVLGERAHPASLAQLWSERWGFMLSYWGLFGGVNVPMPLWIYHVLNGVVVVGVLGFVVYLVEEIGDWRLEIKRNAQSPILRQAQDRFSNLQSLLTNLLNFVAAKFALIVCLLFVAAVIVGLIQWATTTWSSQGRLVFTAISAINVLLVAGLIGWLPRKVGQRLILGVVGFLFLLAALAPLNWIRPAYELNQQSKRWFAQNLVEANFGNKLRLVGFSYFSSSLSHFQPGDTVNLQLEWEVLAPMARDWSVFVHLNDPVIGVPIAQRDMYLDQGLQPTSLLEPGETIFNYYQLTIPETAVAPAELVLSVGLYDFYTAEQERLPLTNGDDSVTLTRLALEPAPGNVPNPTLVNFENELELVGFELNPRQVAAGDTVDLTLYWRAKRPLTTDYTLFVQIVDKDTTLWANVNLEQSTTLWQPGELQAIPVTIPINPDAPANVYPIHLGFYNVTEAGDLDRLQIIAADGRPTDDFLQLTLLRITE